MSKTYKRRDLEISVPKYYSNDGITLWVLLNGVVLFVIYLLPTCFQEDAAKQLEILENEIKDSMNELDKIRPLYDDQVQKEKDIAKRYALVVLVYRYASIKHIACILTFGIVCYL